MARLDELDLKILELLQHNNQLTSEAISRRIGLSSSAVQRRLKRLRKSKVIEFEVSAVSPQAVGRSVSAVVGVKLLRESPELIRRFKDTVRAMPEIMQCYYLTGQHDFVLVVTARDTQDYNLFLEQLAERFPHIAHVDTGIVLERIKTGVSLPLVASRDSIGRAATAHCCA